MNCETLTDMVEHFGCKLEGLRLGVDLRNAQEDDQCRTILSIIQSEVHSLSAIIVLLKSEVAKQKQQLENVQGLKQSILTLNSQLRYAFENIPARLPKKQEQSLPQVAINMDVNMGNQPAVSLNAQPKPLLEPVPVRPKANFCVQQVELLTVEDFNCVPKYMRGRLTYDQLNNTIEELNKALNVKYKLLGQKRSKLSDPNRKKWEKFKSQESKDSTGYYFIVDEDVKAYTSLKVDKTFTNIITVLRHCGRMKEIRGGGITRYAVLLVY